MNIACLNKLNHQIPWIPSKMKEKKHNIRDRHGLRERTKRIEARGKGRKREERILLSFF